MDYLSTRLWSADMENDTTARKDLIPSTVRAYQGKQSFQMNQQAPFSPTFRERVRNFSEKKYDAYRLSCMLWLDSGQVMENAYMVFTMWSGERTYGYAAYPIDAGKLVPGKWNRVESFYFNPYLKHEEDEIQVYIWNAGKADFFVDDMVLELLSLKRPSAP